MKRYNRIIIFFLFIIFAALPGHSQNSRKILWLHGAVPTSTRLDKLAYKAEIVGYDFTDIFFEDFDSDYTANSIPAWADSFNDRLVNANHNNVLGIGHDAGGLILRHMDADQTSGRLSAMILLGTPNQGGKIFNKLLSPLPGDPSDAQKMVSALLNFRTGAQSCVGCRMIEAAQAWLNRFSPSANRAYYEGMKPNSSVITSLSAPTIPTAVIWGNEHESLPFTRLISSDAETGISGADQGYLECYQEELQQRLRALDQADVIAGIRRIAGFAGAFGRFNIANPLTVGLAVEAAILTEATWIQTENQIDNEMREILECELIHQALNAKWVVMLASYTLQQETITEPCTVSCDQCWIDFESDQEEQVLGYCLSVCQNGCEGGTITYTIEYLAPEAHDALLVESEQKLTGATQTYEAKGCNHLQEPFWEYAPIQNALSDLFNGGAGAAFVVPN